MNSRRGSLRRSCLVVHADLPEFLASIVELFLTLALGVGSLIGSLYFVFDQPVHVSSCKVRSSGLFVLRVREHRRICGGVLPGGSQLADR